MIKRKIEDIKILSNSEVAKRYPSLRNTFEHYFPDARGKDIEIMVSIAVGVCRYCWGNGRGCRCWDNI